MFYNVIISFIEFRKKALSLGDKIKTSKYANCKTELIQMINLNYKGYDNNSLLLTLKLIRRITVGHEKRENPFKFYSLPTVRDENLITETLRKIDEKLSAQHINDQNLKKEMMEIESKYSSPKEIILNYLDSQIVPEIPTELSENWNLFNEFDETLFYEEDDDDEDDEIIIQLDKEDSNSHKENIRPVSSEKSIIPSTRKESKRGQPEVIRPTTIHDKDTDTMDKKIDYSKIEETKDLILTGLYNCRTRAGEIKIRLPHPSQN